MIRDKDIKENVEVEESVVWWFVEFENGVSTDVASGKLITIDGPDLQISEHYSHLPGSLLPGRRARRPPRARAFACLLFVHQHAVLFFHGRRDADRGHAVHPVLEKFPDRGSRGVLAVGEGDLHSVHHGGGGPFDPAFRFFLGRYFAYASSCLFSVSFHALCSSASSLKCSSRTLFFM